MAVQVRIVLQKVGEQSASAGAQRSATRVVRGRQLAIRYRGCVDINAAITSVMGQITELHLSDDLTNRQGRHPPSAMTRKAKENIDKCRTGNETNQPASPAVLS